MATVTPILPIADPAKKSGTPGWLIALIIVVVLAVVIIGLWAGGVFSKKKVDEKKDSGTPAGTPADNESDDEDPKDEVPPPDELPPPEPFSIGMPVKLIYTIDKSAKALCAHLTVDVPMSGEAVGTVQLVEPNKIGVRWDTLTNTKPIVGYSSQQCSWKRTGSYVSPEWLGLFLGNEKSNPTYVGAPQSVFTREEADRLLIKF